MKKIATLNNVPENVSYLARNPNEKLEVRSLNLFWKLSNQHLKIDNFQPSGYYEDYLMTATYSEKMQKLQQKQVISLMDYAGSGTVRSLVEVGCGDGSFLKHARVKIEEVVGIEPSGRFAAEARKNGFQVLDGYVSAKNSITTKKFDAFVSRQVFEHLEDPLDVLLGIKSMLNNNAIGLIEVPNGYRAARLKRFYEFFPDHVNYFSVNSLVALASKAGFNVLSCNEAFDSDYLELWVRLDKDFSESVKNIDVKKSEIITTLKNDIRTEKQKGHNVAIWGCGAKTLTMFAGGLSDVAIDIEFIIDSDPHKQGLYIPNTSLQVCSYEQAHLANIDTVYILALSYRQEISELIRKGIKSCSVIRTISNDDRLLDL